MQQTINSPQNIRQRYRHIRRAMVLRRPIAVMAALSMIGSLSFEALRGDLWPDAPRTDLTTTVCICFFSFSLFRFRPSGRRAAGVCVVAVALLSMLVALVLSTMMPSVWFFLTGNQCDVECSRLNPLSNGRMPPITALILALMFASAIWHRSHSRWGFGLAIVAASLTRALLVSLSLGQKIWHDDIPAGTLVALVFATSGLMTIYLHRPFARLLLLSDDIGVRSRVLVLAGFVLPWSAGLVLRAFSDKTYGNDDAHSYVIIALIIGMVGTAVYSGYLQERSDAARRRAERRMAEMINYDELTGVLNRRGLSEILQKQWFQYRSGGGGTGVVILDLDKFKSINDTFGHQTGDKILASIGGAVRPHLRRYDALGRWGGEEFLIVLNTDRSEELAAIGERLRNALELIPAITGPRGEVVRNVTGSFGISWFLPADRSPDDAIRRADKALYLAKNQGRNRAVIYRPPCDKSNMAEKRA